jgi:tetratricopeptide (TPR) repeat protein
MMGACFSEEAETDAGSIQMWMYYNLGCLLAGEDRLKEAEAMYERALRGYEKALGAEHTSTLHTVHNWGVLYADQGRLSEAEAMYERALRGYEKAIKPENIPTYLPALNTMSGLAFVLECQHLVEDARAWYSKALSGYENAVGSHNVKCQMLRGRLAALREEQNEGDLLVKSFRRSTVLLQKVLLTLRLNRTSQPQGGTD